MRVGLPQSYTHPTLVLHAKNEMYYVVNQMFAKISVGCRIKYEKTFVCQYLKFSDFT